jgi:hypothetical protein
MIVYVCVCRFILKATILQSQIYWYSCIIIISIHLYL